MFIKEELCHLANQHTTKYLHKKQHLYLSTSTMKHLYLILNGSCKEYYINDQDQEIVRAFYFSGDIIGLARLNNKNSIFNVSTLENTNVTILPKDILRDKIFLRECLLQSSVNEKIQSLLLCAPDLRARLATFFITYIKDYLKKYGDSKCIKLPITMVELSKYLSITNESLSRFLAKFKQDNILVIKRHTITHYNLSSLQSIASDLPPINRTSKD